MSGVAVTNKSCSRLSMACYLCKRIVKSWTDLQQVNQRKLQYWAMVNIGRQIKVQAYSCWDCIKDAKYLNEKGNNDSKQAWWMGLQNIPKNFNDISSDDDEDCDLANESTRDVQLKRLPKQGKMSVRASTKNSPKQHKCPGCLIKFQRQRQLIHHVKKCHPKLHMCKFCNSTFTKAIGLRVHYNFCMKSRCNVKCTKCNFRCLSDKMLAVHDMMKHQPAFCWICKKTVGNKLNLKVHNRRNHGEGDE